MKRLGILTAALACAHPQLPGPVADRSLSLPSHSVIAVAGANAGDPAIVQVRDFPHSSIISVVAWSPAETSFGLRANLTRDGKLVRDHRLYVSVFYDGLRTTLATASPSRFVAPRYVVTAGPSPRLLLSTGIARDEYACFYDFDNCTRRGR